MLPSSNNLIPLGQCHNLHIMLSWRFIWDNNHFGLKDGKIFYNRQYETPAIFLALAGVLYTDWCWAQLFKDFFGC